MRDEEEKYNFNLIWFDYGFIQITNKRLNSHKNDTLNWAWRAFESIPLWFGHTKTREQEAPGTYWGFSANGMWQFSLKERERETEFRNARLEPVQKWIKHGGKNSMRMIRATMKRSQPVSICITEDTTQPNRQRQPQHSHTLIDTQHCSCYAVVEKTRTKEKSTVKREWGRKREREYGKKSGRELNYRKTTTYRRQFCNRILTSNKHLIKLKRPLEHTHLHNPHITFSFLAFKRPVAIVSSFIRWPLHAMASLAIAQAQCKQPNRPKRPTSKHRPN